MAAASLLLATSTKKLAPTTVIPLLHNRPPISTPVPRCHNLSSLAINIEQESPACRSIHDTLSSIHAMGRVVLLPEQVWTSIPNKAKKVAGATSTKKRGTSSKASVKSIESTSESSAVSATEVEKENAPSLSPLESGLGRMQPRHREVIELAMNTQLST